MRQLLLDACAVVILVVFLGMMALLVACGSGSAAVGPTEPIAMLDPVLEASLPSTCTANQDLPDPNCTPGVIDPRVTQGNIRVTICASGYTSTVRPPVSYTNALKLKQIKAYHYAKTNPRLYEEDHLISLELGGAPSDPKNLWPEYGASPNAKDKVENELHALVCAGKMPLAEAQRRIATNWKTALQ